jgi:hypothetical protein
VITSASHGSTYNCAGSWPPWFGFVPAFALHTAIVYTCALHISGYLVFRWFAWFAPILQISTSVPPRGLVPAAS